MSVIALHGVPQTWKKKAVNNNLKPLLGKNIAVLQFAEGPKNSPTKICFIEIPADMDIKLAIAKINTHKFNGKKKMYAVVPVYNELPQTLPTSSNIEKMEKSANLLPSTILAGAHEQILIEMQSKFTGLHSLSLRTGHKLMNEIAEIICQRLNDIGKDGQSMTGFQLTEAYRKRHPHFGDFQLIVSTLHALQDKARVPRTHIEEPALVKAKANVQPYSLENISLTKITQTCDKYSEKIVKTLDEHIKNLKETYNLQPTEENSGEIAKNNVRKALKSVRPYLPNIVRKLMAEYFVPNNAPFVRMRVGNSSDCDELPTRFTDPTLDVKPSQGDPKGDATPSSDLHESSSVDTEEIDLSERCLVETAMAIAIEIIKIYCDDDSDQEYSDPKENVGTGVIDGVDCINNKIEDFLDNFNVNFSLTKNNEAVDETNVQVVPVNNMATLSDMALEVINFSSQTSCDIPKRIDECTGVIINSINKHFKELCKDSKRLENADSSDNGVSFLKDSKDDSSKGLLQTLSPPTGVVETKTIPTLLAMALAVNNLGYQEFSKGSKKTDIETKIILDKIQFANSNKCDNEAFLDSTLRTDENFNSVSFSISLAKDVNTSFNDLRPKTVLVEPKTVPSLMTLVVYNFNDLISTEGPERIAVGNFSCPDKKMERIGISNSGNTDLKVAKDLVIDPNNNHAVSTCSVTKSSKNPSIVEILENIDDNLDKSDSFTPISAEPKVGYDLDDRESLDNQEMRVSAVTWAKIAEPENVPTYITENIATSYKTSMIENAQNRQKNKYNKIKTYQNIGSHRRTKLSNTAIQWLRQEAIEFVKSLREPTAGLIRTNPLADKTNVNNFDESTTELSKKVRHSMKRKAREIEKESQHESTITRNYAKSLVGHGDPPYITIKPVLPAQKRIINLKNCLYKKEDLTVNILNRKKAQRVISLKESITISSALKELNDVSEIVSTDPMSLVQVIDLTNVSEPTSLLKLKDSKSSYIKKATKKKKKKTRAALSYSKVKHFADSNVDTVKSKGSNNFQLSPKEMRKISKKINRRKRRDALRRDIDLAEPFMSIEPFPTMLLDMGRTVERNMENPFTWAPLNLTRDPLEDVNYFSDSENQKIQISHECHRMLLEMENNEQFPRKRSSDNAESLTYIGMTKRIKLGPLPKLCGNEIVAKNNENVAPLDMEIYSDNVIVEPSECPQEMDIYSDLDNVGPSECPQEMDIYSVLDNVVSSYGPEDTWVVNLNNSAELYSEIKASTPKVSQKVSKPQTIYEVRRKEKLARAQQQLFGMKQLIDFRTALKSTEPHTLIKFAIVPQNFPNQKFTTEHLGVVQRRIVYRWAKSQNIPEITLGDVIGGAIHVTLHSVKSAEKFKAIEGIQISRVPIKVVNVWDLTKVKIAWSTRLFGVWKYEELLSLLQKHNPMLDTKQWEVVETAVTNDIVRRVIMVNQASADYIKNSGFKLHTGLTTSTFEILEKEPKVVVEKIQDNAVGSDENKSKETKVLFDTSLVTTPSQPCSVLIDLTND